ncbi:MAG: glycosyltransferase family 39 protein [Acidobacteria bacterium]|nr:glycosyltransferase family 39 protein [Acidobacteriota bacterium]
MKKNPDDASASDKKIENIIKTKQLKKWENLLYLILLITLSSHILFTNLGDSTPYFDELIYCNGELHLDNLNDNLFFPKGELARLYKSKPPLKIWIKYPILKIFGLNMFTLRVLDAAMGLIVIVIIFLIGKRLSNGACGFLAGLIFLTFSGIYNAEYGRMNAYETGLVLGVLLAYYFFLFHWETRWGPILVGLFIAFAFYFKVIVAFIPLGAMGVYLLYTKKWKGVFNLKIVTMSVSIILPIAAWFIPFSLQNRTYLNKLFMQDIGRIVAIERPDVYATEPLFYFKSLFWTTGIWGPIFVLAFLMTIYRWIKTKDKYLFFYLIWFIIPFIVLSITTNKAPRYLFLTYPALALMISSTVFTIIKNIKRDFVLAKLRMNTTVIKYSVIFIVIAISLIAYIQTIGKTKPFIVQNFHAIANFCNSTTDGNMYLTDPDVRNYNFAFRVIKHIDQERIIDASKKDRTELIKNLGKNDCVVLYNHTILDTLYFNNSNHIKPEEYSYVDFTSREELGKYYKSRRKKVIFRSDSNLTEYLVSKNERVVRFYPKDSLDNLDNESFVRYLLHITLLSDGEYRNNTAYYVNQLNSGNYNRAELIESFKCYAANMTPDELPIWWKNGKPIGQKSAFFSFVDFYRPDISAMVNVTGLKKKNLPITLLCYFKRLENRVTYHKRKIKLDSILQTLQDNDSIIIRHSDMIRFLKKKDPAKTVSGYYYCPLKGRAGPLKVQSQYFNITAIFPANGNLHRYFRSENVDVYAFVHPDNLIDWNTKSDEKFIIDSARLIFNSAVQKKYINHFIKKLGKGKLTRRILVDNFLEQAEQIDF